MPLSKARQVQWMGEYRKRLKSVIPKSASVIPKSASVIPKSASVIPKLPWYAGAGNHFGEIRNKRYADEFFSIKRYT